MTARQGLPFEEIKARISCDEYARNVLRLDLHADGDGWRGQSFRTDAENPTSLHISNGLWVDFGTGKGGDVISLCAEANHGGDTGAAIKELAELTGLKVDGGANTVYSQKRASLAALIQHWHSLLTDDDREYLHKRKINDETIDALLIGRGDGSCLTYGRHMGRLIVPYWRNGQPVYFISRSMAGCWKEEGKISVYSADKGGFVDSYDVGDEAAARESWEIYGGKEIDGAKYIKAFKGTAEKPNNELEHCVWGLDTLTRKSNAPLVIAEGMFDALSFWQEGYRVISPITGRFSKEQIPDVLSAARLAGRVCAVFDNDGRGADFRVHAAQMLFDAGVKFTTARVPKEYKGDEIKDISDYYERGGDISVFVDEPPRGYMDKTERGNAIRFPDNPFDLQTGLVYVARCEAVWGDVTAAMRDADFTEENIGGDSNASDKVTHITRADALAAVKKVMRTGNRFRYSEFSEYKYNLKDILKRMTNDSEELTAIWKWLDSSPRDAEAAEWVKAKHTYINIPRHGMYEYERGAWRAKDEEVVRAAVQKELGRFKSKGLESATAGLISTAPEVVRDKMILNKQDIFNFKNGVLDLKTGKFGAHSPNYYSSFQVEYDYNPDAQCPAWNDFIFAVCAGDAERMTSLQEMAGSVLFPNNKFGKAYIIKGEGSNGKSVFLDIMADLFGGYESEAVSTLDLIGFTNEFRVARLAGAIVNISHEMTTSRNELDELAIFKDACTGSEIEACHKHKPHFNFRPRAKMFFAANDFFKAHDTSYALVRRLLFVTFPVLFAENGVETPTRAACKGLSQNEITALFSQVFKSELGLLDILRAELSGIFNWAYEGYKRLLKNGKLTETADHVATMKEFQREINTVYVFVEEGVFHQRMTRGAVYAVYTKFCKLNGLVSPLGEIKFRREFTRALNASGRSFKERKVHGERGYVFEWGIPDSATQGSSEEDDDE